MKNTEEISVSEKLNKIDISQEEKELIIDNGLRFRILESENELKKINFEIRKLEKEFGMSFEKLEKVGLPNDADYITHENYMDLKALIYDRIEVEERLAQLKKALISE